MTELETILGDNQELKEPIKKLLLKIVGEFETWSPKMSQEFDHWTQGRNNLRATVRQKIQEM